MVIYNHTLKFIVKGKRIVNRIFYTFIMVWIIHYKRLEINNLQYNTQYIIRS